MLRIYLWLARPKALVAGAVIANIVHPLIHGTPLDSGALDACVVSLSAAAMCHHEEN